MAEIIERINEMLYDVGSIVINPMSKQKSGNISEDGCKIYIKEFSIKNVVKPKETNTIDDAISTGTKSRPIKMHINTSSTDAIWTLVLFYKSIEYVL